MTTVDDDIFDDGTGSEASTDSLATIVALAERMTNLEGDVSKAKAHHDALVLAHREIAEKLLPDALANAKLKDLTLEDGRKLKLKEDLTISVPKKRLGEVVSWLRKDGNGDMVANVLTIDIPKGKDNVVAQLQDEASKLGFEATRTESVNSTSLKALLNRKLKDGISVDLSFFGAFRLTRAEISEK